MYCIPENPSENLSWQFLEEGISCIDCWINKISLPCPEDVGKLPNLVKYCVDYFSLLFLCSCHIGYVSGCISLCLVGGFFREVVVLRTTWALHITTRDWPYAGSGSFNGEVSKLRQKITIWVGLGRRASSPRKPVLNLPPNQAKSKRMKEGIPKNENTKIMDFNKSVIITLFII